MEEVKTIQTLRQEVQHNAEQLAPEIKDLSNQLNTTFDSVMSKMKTDAQQRQALLGSFDYLSKQIQICSQKNLSDQTLLSQLAIALQQVQQAHVQLRVSHEELAQVRTLLTQQLEAAKQKADTLQQELDTLKDECATQTQKRDILVDETTELSKLSQQHQTFVEEQSSLLKMVTSKLSSALNTLRSLGQNVVEKSKDVVAEYAGDTMLTQIKEFVLTDEEIGKILEQTEITLEDASRQVEARVKTYWIVGKLEPIIEQLNETVETLEQTGDTPTSQSLPFWKQYLDNLIAFKNTLMTYLFQWISEWLIKRKPSLLKEEKQK